jgi:hypothetical protein
MQHSKRSFVLSNIPVKQWVLRTAAKMSRSDTEALLDWHRCWLKSYRELGGRSGNSGSKACPKVAAYALWYLGQLCEAGRCPQAWTVREVNRDFGKNAAYAVIAAELLARGATSNAKSLWSLVQTRYRDQTGQDPAHTEQGAIKLMIALFCEKQLTSSQHTQA